MWYIRHIETKKVPPNFTNDVKRKISKCHTVGRDHRQGQRISRKIRGRRLFRKKYGGEDFFDKNMGRRFFEQIKGVKIFSLQNLIKAIFVDQCWVK